MVIDTTYDFRTDARGKDPDSHSPTLRRYHKLLWSKPLRSGHLFTLSDTVPGAYLHHRSDLGEFVLSSDSVLPTFTAWKRLHHITSLLSEEERRAFVSITYTIGGMMLFPANRVGGKNTINGERGFNALIRDRFDLTAECIRRHYVHLPSPLGDTLGRYQSFFTLFGDFAGYVEFFHLQDLVTADYEGVRFFMPFDEFQTSPVPRDVQEYRAFRAHTIDFVEARNHRISATQLS